MIVDSSRCMHCGACVGTCPKNAIFLREVELEFNEDCVRCGLCVRVCPVGALAMDEECDAPVL
ncbi:MAG: 4Fe-4S binding protein [Candidatus Thermoplasmatota archaeon]